jgi:hypothetical protein
MTGQVSSPSATRTYSLRHEPDDVDMMDLGNGRRYLSKLRLRFDSDFSLYDEAIELRCYGASMNIPTAAFMALHAAEAQIMHLTIMDAYGAPLGSTEYSGLGLGITLAPITFATAEPAAILAAPELRFGPHHVSDLVIDASADFTLSATRAATVKYQFRGYHRGALIDTAAGDRIHLRLPYHVAGSRCRLFHQGVESPTTQTHIDLPDYRQVYLSIDSLTKPWTRPVLGTDLSLCEIRCDFVRADGDFEEHPDFTMAVAVARLNATHDPLDPASYPYLYQSIPSSAFRVPRMTAFYASSAVVYSGFSAGAYGTINFTTSVVLGKDLPQISFILLHAGNHPTSTVVGDRYHCSATANGFPALASVSVYGTTAHQVHVFARVMFNKGVPIDFVVQCSEIKLLLDVHGVSHQNTIIILPSAYQDTLLETTLSQVNMLTITAPEQHVHFGGAKAFYRLRPADQAIDATFTPLAVTVTDANVYAIDITLPTTFPHLFTDASTPLALLYGSETCDSATTLLSLKSFALASSAYSARIPLSPHALLTETACLSVTVNNVDMLPLGIPAQNITIELHHLPSESYVPVLAFPVPILPDDTAMVVRSDPTNTQSFSSCATHYAATECTNTIVVNFPVSLNSDRNI